MTNYLQCVKCVGRHGPPGCNATHSDDDGQPSCVWCLDGEPCPVDEKKARKGKPIEANQTNLAHRRRNPSAESECRMTVAASERVCGTPGCGKAIRQNNGSRFCSKHFYHSKMKHSPGAVRGKKRGPSLVTGNGQAASRVPVYLDEEQLDRFIVKLEMAEKAKLVNAFLSGAI